MNLVSRTPSQMAAFVGNHVAVATINNFIPKSELEYYTKLQGQQTEPYLPVYLLDAFHSFVIQSNIHPVRIALNLQRIGSFNEHLKQLRKVLEMMVEREMQRRDDINEIMAFKYHYLGWIVAEIIKCREHFALRCSAGDAAKTDYCELFAKRMLKVNRNGQLDFLESSIRDCVREFPFRECTVFRQVVAQLASKDPSPALDVVRSAINGQRGFAVSFFGATFVWFQVSLEQFSLCVCRMKSRIAALVVTKNQTKNVPNAKRFNIVIENANVCIGLCIRRRVHVQRPVRLDQQI